jgi:hypothetical protein
MQEHSTPLKSELFALMPRAVGATLVFLLLPWVASRWTQEVQWGPEDYAAAAVLVYCTSVSLLLLQRRVRSPHLRRGAVAGVLLCAVLIWVELAVGLTK